MWRYIVNGSGQSVSAQKALIAVICSCAILAEWKLTCARRNKTARTCRCKSCDVPVHEMSGRPAKWSRAFERDQQHLCATSCDSEVITITTITEQTRARG